MTTRREFIKGTAVGGAGLVVGPGLLSGRPRAATSRAPAVSARAASVASSLTPYLDPMPILVDNAVDATGGGTVRLTAALISRKVHSQLPVTTLFGYLRPGGPGAGDTAASYLGPASPDAAAVKVVARTHKTLIWGTHPAGPAAAAPAAGVLPRRAGGF